MDMQESSDMSKQTLFNDTLEELIDAYADYREAEQPDSGQGSWGAGNALQSSASAGAPSV